MSVRTGNLYFLSELSSYDFCVHGVFTLQNATANTFATKPQTEHEILIMWFGFNTNLMRTRCSQKGYVSVGLPT